MKEKLIDKIKKSNLYRLINCKTEIKDLNAKIGDLESERKDLIDLLEIEKQEKKHLKNNDIKVATFEAILERTEKELKKKLETIKKQTAKIKEINKRNTELESQKIEDDLEIARWKTQCEEYEQQIKDLHTEGKFIVKKIRATRTPNTQKTKIARPMARSVERYMRGEHE